MWEGRPSGNVTLSQFHSLKHERHLLGFISHLDDIAFAHAEAGNVHALAVDRDVAMVDKLPRREHRRHELHTVDHRVKPLLEQTDEVLASVTAASHRFVVSTTELLLRNIAVVATQALLGAELNTIVARFAASLPMLARAVFSDVHRALGPAPQVFPEAAVELVFRTQSFGHRLGQKS